MSKDTKPTDQQDDVWGTKARWSISLIAIGIVILMGCIWGFTPEITREILHARGFTESQAKLINYHAQWGDSFGATNALFSGIALVAAVTAVAFQVIELGGQRQEIRLQLQAMKEANVTGDQRLKLDRQTYEYERHLKLVSLLREFDSEEIEASRKQFAELDNAPFPYRDICRAAFSETIKTGIVDSFDSVIEREQFIKWTECARNSEPFLRHLNEVCLFDPSPQEFMPWVRVVLDFQKLLLVFVSAACETTDVFHPTWESGVTTLIARVCDKRSFE